jgi:hypothetical protein
VGQELMSICTSVSPNTDSMLTQFVTIYFVKTHESQLRLGSIIFATLCSYSGGHGGQLCVHW